MPHRHFATLLLAALGTTAVLPWCPAADLISEAEARQQGLTRAWFSQVQVDSRRHMIERVMFSGDQLMVLTTAGSLQAYDAESGRRLWSTRAGNPSYPSLGPAVGGQFVAIVNGSTVFVFDRQDGRELTTFKTRGAAGAGPAMLDGYVYVPLFNGRLTAFPINAERTVPWHYSSSGRLFQTPVTASDSVVWTNDRGYLYGANAASSGVRYFFESNSSFVAAPTAMGESIYAATVDGDVLAMEERRGRRTWRYAAGDSVVYSPVALGDQLFVATEEPALHTLNRNTGRVQWITGGAAQFVAASEKRVYGLDRHGSLLVMDRQTGAPISRVASRGQNTPVLNQKNDRLYVYSPSGLLQCFHEIGADKPYVHSPIEAPVPAESLTPNKPAAPSPEPTPDETPAADPFAGDGGGDDPFGGGGGGGDPFGGGAGDDSGGGEDDPFGGDPFAGGDDPFGG